AHLRLVGVRQPQLEHRVECLADRWPDAGPPVRGDDDVDAVSGTSLGDLRDGRLQVSRRVVGLGIAGIVTDGGPAIDDEEYYTLGIFTEFAPRLSCPVVGSGRYPGLGEGLLAAVDELAALRHDPAH